MKQFQATDFARFLSDIGDTSTPQVLPQLYYVEDEPLLGEFTASAYEVARSAHHLSVDVDHVPVGKTHKLMRLPFKNLLIGYSTELHYGTKNGKRAEDPADIVLAPMMLLASEEPEHETTIMIPFMYFPPIGWVVASGPVKLMWDDTVEPYNIPGTQCIATPDREATLTNSISMLLDVLELVHCSNVSVKPVTPSRLRQMRAKKKGDILESYSVIELPGSQRSSQHHGGTHASPCLHKRRGHYRTIASGKTVYVRDCIVGSWDNGVKNTDYKI